MAVALVFGAADAIFPAAAATMPPRLLPRERHGQGAAVSATTARLALAAGAPLGGALVAAGGPASACVVDAATFVVSVLSLRSLPPGPAAPAHREPITAGLRSGLRYLAGHPVLRTLVVVSRLANLGFVGPRRRGSRSRRSRWPGRRGPSSRRPSSWG